MSMKLKSLKLYFESQAGWAEVYLDSAGEVTKIDLEGKLGTSDIMDMAAELHKVNYTLWPTQPISKEP